MTCPGPRVEGSRAAVWYPNECVCSSCRSGQGSGASPVRGCKPRHSSLSCRFHICDSAYSLQMICSPQIDICHTLAVIHGRVQSREKLNGPRQTVQARVKAGNAPPPSFSSRAVIKRPLLCCHRRRTVCCLFLMILQFKMAPRGLCWRSSRWESTLPKRGSGV